VDDDRQEGRGRVAREHPFDEVVHPDLEIDDVGELPGEGFVELVEAPKPRGSPVRGPMVLPERGSTPSFSASSSAFGTFR